MSKVIGRCVRGTVVAFGIGLLLSARTNAQCLGDCNGDGTVGPGELNKVIAIILNCSSAAAGCGAVPGGCTAADKNGDHTIQPGELNNIIFNILNFPPKGCPATSPTPTKTLGVVPTNTIAPTNTPTRVPSQTPTPTTGAAVCGNGITESNEDCDDGGFCIGGDNAGIKCNSEAQCQGQGVCTEGVKIGTACNGDADCPDAKCIHCKPCGGDGCAANCTFEQDIAYDLVPGAVKVCKGGANDGKGCNVVADCPPSSPPQTPGPSCTTYKQCLGGPNDNKLCSGGVDCPGGICNQAVKPGSSGAFVHDGLLQLALPISGTQTLTIGKKRNNEIPGVIKATSVKLPAIGVGPVACACVRAIATKTCGGTVFDFDGSGSTDCTDGFTAGASVCTDAGKKPCAFVHGPGNASSGLIGCNGLEGVNLSFTQDEAYAPCGTQVAGGVCPTPYPPAPTPPAGSGLPVITLSGSGGPGSSIVLNSSAIGTAVGACNQAGSCHAGSNAGKACTKNADCPGSTCDGVKVLEVSGPDLTFCSNVGVSCDNGPPCDDDPQSSRGVPQTLPQVTGTATGLITNTYGAASSARVCKNKTTQTCRSDADCGADGPCLFNIGPFSYTGSPYDCAKLEASPPTAEGGNVVGAFTGLNQPSTGDIVVRNTFIIGPRK
ncbi:MAG TPA: hypothetical protein VMW56_02770 [Candidatus Margulisiibacteriota bacterium]|nr:hypothetical protein [Candidatus Margulisiibacteriota bacterium]